MMVHYFSLKSNVLEFKILLRIVWLGPLISWLIARFFLHAID